MEVKLDKNRNLTMKHHLKKSEMYKINKGKKFSNINIYSAPQICKGFSSKTEDNQHILLLDFDNTDISVVKEDIKFLQLEEGLPPAYIFCTKEQGYHVIFLSKHSPREIMDLMKHTHIDANFYDSPLRTKYRSWVLRIGGKGNRGRPKFLGILDIKKKPISDFPISLAHKELLSKLYNIKHPNYGKLEDSYHKIKLQEYQTK